jgi:hypothetical protein
MICTGAAVIYHHCVINEHINTDFNEFQIVRPVDLINNW